MFMSMENLPRKNQLNSTCLSRLINTTRSGHYFFLVGITQPI